MVVIYGNTGSVPLIGSKVIRDRACDGSVWSEKGPRIRATPKPDQSCVRSGADQPPEWSDKAPLWILKAKNKVAAADSSLHQAKARLTLPRLSRMDSLSLA